MTSDDRRDSLADQAAAWVPPWVRDRSVEPVEDLVPAEAVDGPRLVEPVEDLAPVEPVEDLVPAEPVDGPRLVEQVEEPAASAPAPAPDGSPPPDRPVVAQISSGDDVEMSAGDDVEMSAGGDAEVAAGDVPGGDPEPESAGEPAAAFATAAAGPPGSTLDLVNEDELRGALEAILLVVDEPVAEIVLAQVLEQPAERIAVTLEQLARAYTAAGHGFELRRAAGGWRLYTRPEYASYVERFILDGQSVRLTQAALETLAVVAYKQPVTRSRISAIRGVNCDGVIRTLVSRSLIEECGTEPDSGAFLYRTTTLFLEKLGLDTVGELPPLAPFLPDDVEEIEDAPR